MRRGVHVRPTRHQERDDVQRRLPYLANEEGGVGGGEEGEEGEEGEKEGKEGERRGVTPVYEYAAPRTPPHTAHRTPHRSRWVRFSILLVSSPYSRVKTI